MKLKTRVLVLLLGITLFAGFTTSMAEGWAGMAERWADVIETHEVITLWPEGNMPATTVYTEDAGSQYFDPPEFQPNMVYFPASDGTEIKGAVLLCAGGAFSFRGNEGDSYPTAEYFNSLGYHCYTWADYGESHDRNPLCFP